MNNQLALPKPDNPGFLSHDWLYSQEDYNSLPVEDKLVHQGMCYVKFTSEAFGYILWKRIQIDES